MFFILFLYRQTAYEKKIVKGKSTDAIAATCLFIACRNKNDPRTIKEVCAVSRTSKKKFWKIYKKISPVVDIGVINPTAGDFIPRFCSKLRLSNEILKAALAISTAANTLCLATNRRASSVAAGVIYMASSVSIRDYKTCIIHYHKLNVFYISMGLVDKGKTNFDECQRDGWDCKIYY